MVFTPTGPVLNTGGVHWMQSDENPQRRKIMKKLIGITLGAVAALTLAGATAVAAPALWTPEPGHSGTSAVTITQPVQPNTTHRARHAHQVTGQDDSGALATRTCDGTGCDTSCDGAGHHEVAQHGGATHGGATHGSGTHGGATHDGDGHR